MVGRAVYTDVFVSVGVGEDHWRSHRKFWSLKYFWPAWAWAWGCSCKWKWKPFSSNSSEWVSWTRFHSQNLELLNRRKCWSGLKQFEQLLLDTGFKMDHWRLFPPKNLHLRFVCFVFIFIRGPHRKGLLNSFLCKLPLCSCKVLFLSLCCKLHFH